MMLDMNLTNCTKNIKLLMLNSSRNFCHPCYIYLCTFSTYSFDKNIKWKNIKTNQAKTTKTTERVYHLSFVEVCILKKIATFATKNRNLNIDVVKYLFLGSSCIFGNSLLGGGRRGEGTKPQARSFEREKKLVHFLPNFL